MLLLTNDGDLTERLLHPSKEVEKTYLARVTGAVSLEELSRLMKGVSIDGRMTSRAKARVIHAEDGYTDLMITIHEGRNRQVRKMVEAIGHEVLHAPARALRPADAWRAQARPMAGADGERKLKTFARPEPPLFFCCSCLVKPQSLPIQ